MFRVGLEACAPSADHQTTISTAALWQSVSSLHHQQPTAISDHAAAATTPGDGSSASPAVSVINAYIDEGLTGSSQLINLTDGSKT